MMNSLSMSDDGWQAKPGPQCMQHALKICRDAAGGSQEVENEQDQLPMYVYAIVIREAHLVASQHQQQCPL